MQLTQVFLQHAPWACAIMYGGYEFQMFLDYSPNSAVTHFFVEICGEPQAVLEKHCGNFGEQCGFAHGKIENFDALQKAIDINEAKIQVACDSQIKEYEKVCVEMGIF